LIYREKWIKNPVSAILQCFRDVIIYYTPFLKIPKWLLGKIYKVVPRFIFLVHPRRSEDIFIALPFLSILRKVLSKKKAMKLIKLIPPFVLSTIKTSSGTEGVVVSSLFLPDSLMDNRRKTLKEYFRVLKFAKKIGGENVVLGLGAWWPIVTRRGLALRDVAEQKKIKVTNGHTGTLISLFLMIKRIAQISDINVSDLKIAIIGAGKMGTNLGRALAGGVAELGIIDINERRLSRFVDNVGGNKCSTNMRKILRENGTDLKRILNSYHLAVCVTSNARRIIDKSEIPSNFIIIDDSRPEAISRDGYKENKIVLEGGLINIEKIISSYDFGFGIDQNVFGCLAETYMVALDRGEKLDPTYGDVDIENFHKMLNFCKENDIRGGDFKSQDILISEDKIRSVMHKREIEMVKKK